MARTVAAAETLTGFLVALGLALAFAFLTGLGVLCYFSGAFPVFKFVKFLYYELNILVALILPDARFTKLLVSARLGEVDSEKTDASDVAELLLKVPYQLAGVVPYNNARLLGLLFIGKGAAMP